MKNLFLLLIAILLLQLTTLAQVSNTAWTKIIVDELYDGCWGIDCEDLDGDEDVDIIISQSVLGKIDWYENIGNYEFISHNIFNSNNLIGQIEAVDLDNDSDMDIVFGEEISGLQVLVNDGQNNFAVNQISPDGHWKFKTIDVNQDSMLDVVVNNNSLSTTVYWLEQNSDHSFTSHLIDDDCGHAYGIDAIDLDGDDDIDIIQGAINMYDDLYWYENDGDEIFTKHSIDNNINDPLDLICEDIDNDNDVDIVVPEVSYPSFGELRWYENDGTQQFSYNIISDMITAVWFVGVADLDSNNTNDVIATYRDTSCLKWFSNDGNQQFTEFNIDDSIQCPVDFILTDFNGDGFLDIALLSGFCTYPGVSGIPQLTIYINNLKPSFVWDNQGNLGMVEDYHLYQNYPNPFNPSTKISWQVSAGSWQTLKIYDVLGNEVATLVDEYKPSGSYEVEWNASEYPSGNYFYQLKTEGFVETKKMMLMR